MTRGGVIAGMVIGMASTILWKNIPALQAILDLKAASFLLASVAAIVVSWIGVGPRVVPGR